MAIMAVDNSKRIKRLFTYLLFSEEVVAPGLLTKIYNGLKTVIVTYSA